ncbi:ATP-binding cassette domain-containing protein [Lacticaseibacillus brantae]|uniref:Uncharacterized protein n=1 Tax=Lacticaseibacillus brantae DSM 23927 TaxID=1423727 RepID=A0A0R2AWE3_9LACO|nr:ABC transporter ATP-binding protein [Lacticaseibacillus brantae]KRM71303.1 hypothetical protein FC34_GL001783 [Lacticaseibacillus brantae DSM 23927]
MKTVIRPYRLRFAGLGFIALINIVAATGSAVVLTIAINAILARNMAQFFLWMLASFGCFVIAKICDYISGVGFERTVQAINHDVRQAVLQDTTSSYAKILTYDQNAGLNLLTNDIVILTNKYFYGRFRAFQSAASVIMAGIALLAYHWSLILTALVLAALLLVAPQLAQARLEGITAVISKANENLTAQVKDWTAGLTELYWNGALHRLWPILQKPAHDVEQANVREQQIGKSLSAALELLDLFSQVVLLALCGFLAIIGTVSFGVVVSTGNLAGQIFGASAQFALNLGSIAQGKAIAAKLDPILTATAQPEAAGTAHLDLQAPVAISAQGLSYEFATHQTVSFPDFTIHPGQKVAILGESGRGKTTLTNIITGTYPNYSGSLVLQDTEVSQLDPQDLNALIGVMNQTPTLFPTSLKENVLLFDNQLAPALATTLGSVNLATKVSELPEQEETQVNPDGSELSGGERQRLALARALIRDKKVLVIDEGTSALDSANETAIVNYLLALPDITVILITHSTNQALLDRFDQQIAL